MEQLNCFNFIPPGLPSPFLQLTSLGLVWVFLHCSPMCGPIISGLGLATSSHPLRALFLYQAGRGLSYAVFGAMAGMFGAFLLPLHYWGWIIVVVLGLMLVSKIFPGMVRIQERTPQWLMRSVARAQSFAGWKRPFVFGILFAFLPCMLSLWALTLAASTQSFWGGALLMMLLVAMTTLPLLTVTWGISRIFKTHQQGVSTILLAISFLWTLLVTLAGNGLIDHKRLMFRFLGESYTLMFW